MNRLARRERAPRGRARWTLLLVVAGLLACGGERPDEAKSGAPAVAAAAKPAPVGECRRFTTCVPENPCHTGWVTGCRKNVPICTDIGGWLDNGTSCGAGRVCSMGQCLPCAAGEQCTVRDQWQNEIGCRSGAISCASGQPVCEDVGPAPDGRLCTEGGYGAYVCKGGGCVWCVDGDWCQLPEQPCHVASITACATTGGTCTDSGTFFADGSFCPHRDGNSYTGVCAGGACLACDWWTACTPPAPANECVEQSAEGWVQCYDGNVSCQPSGSWWKPDGTPCSGGVCQGGTCLPACVPDQPCTQGCQAGVTVCTGPASSSCQPTGNVPDGTGCGPGAFCSAGSCLACGSTCSGAADFCHPSGTVSCETGSCVSSPAPDGTSCGASAETCRGGSCSGVAGAPVRTSGQRGVVDLTGVTWTRCEVDWGALSSRWTEEVYGLGTLTHLEDTYPGSTDCTGTPDGEAHLWVEAVVTTAGYRYAGWLGTPPAGAWSPVLATALHASGIDAARGRLIDLKLVVWVDDSVTPRALYMGDEKAGGGVDADGYPLALVPDARLEVISRCGAPCDPGFPTCDRHAWDCAGGAPVCADTGADLVDREPCGDGLTCTAGVCGAVAPRTVTGTSPSTFWPDAGALPPVDTSYFWKSAVIFTGQTSTRRVEADTMGTPWSIAGVPSASYLLELSGVPNTGATRSILSNRGSFEAGLDVLGRPDAAWSWGSPVAVTLTVRGLVPVRRLDWVGLVCSNVGVALQPFGNGGSPGLPVDAGEATATIQWQLPRIDALRGDVAYLFQSATTFDAESGSSVTALARWGTLPDGFTIGAEPVGADVTLQPCEQTDRFTADWRLSQFAGYATQVHPDARVLRSQLGLYARPHESPFAPGWVNGDVFNGPGIPLVLFRPGNRTTDLVSSGVPFGRFLPLLWHEYRLARTVYQVPFTAPGASRPASLQVTLLAVEPAAGASTPVVPVVTPPRALLVGGQDAMAGAAHVGLMPVISWGLPEVLPALPVPIYEVAVHEVLHGPDGAGTQLVERYRGQTTRQSFRLPGTNLHWNGRYVVAVTATVSAETIDAPLRASVVKASATAVSREFTP